MMSSKIKVSGIKLTNFRLFEDLTINFDENLTVFIGINGAGKTTILEAIAGCLQYIKEKIQGRIQSEFFKDTDIKIGKDIHSFGIALTLSEPSTLLSANYNTTYRY